MPAPTNYPYTLRQWYAIQCLAAALSRSDNGWDVNRAESALKIDNNVTLAFEYADRMIAVGGL